MEKILFLQLFQPFAQFRNPFTFFYAQTFPLPPKSTILGFLENATSKYYSGEFDDLQISIWGYHSTIYWNYLHFIKGDPYIDERGIIRGKDSKPLYGINSSQRTPIYQQEIMGLNLFLFFKGDDIKKLKLIEEMLSNVSKVLYLGRGEDIVFIRNIRILEKNKDFEEEYNLKDFRVKIGAYIKGDKILEEDTLKRMPVYSTPLIQKFVYKDDVNKNIKNRIELLSKKSKLKRKVNFEKVFYVENLHLRLKNPQKAIKFKYQDKNIQNELRFYLIDNLTWL